MSEFSTWTHPPGPGPGQQCSPQFDERHQLWPSQIGYPDPIVYVIDVLLRTHSFTTSKVLVISASGRPRTSFDASGNTFAPGTKRTLPPSTIYGFNGTFGGKTFSLHFPHHGFVGDLFTVQRHGVTGAGGEAAQVALPVPRRVPPPGSTSSR